jgi:molybdate transport system substrate-binding protein
LKAEEYHMRDLAKPLRLRVDPASSRTGVGLGSARIHGSARVVFAIAAILTLPAVSFAQVKVIISGGFSAAYRELLPEFERTSGITVATTTGGSQGDGPNTIGAQLRRGALADVVIMNRAGLDELIAQGRIVGGTDVNVAQTYLGLAVRAGAPKPNISTVDAFRQTLLRAKSVTMDGSTTGIYLTTKLFPRLGIADEMARKSTTTGVTAVASGNAEIAVQPVSEILPVHGVDFVGTIPAEVQYVAVFAAAVVAGSKEAEASGRLIAFLTSEGATAAIKKSGMEPAKRR